MADIGKVVNVRVGDIEVVCRELTVAKLRGVLESQRAGDLLTDFLFVEVPLDQLPVLTNLTLDQIELMEPSAIRLVIEGCKQANPDFFGLLARIASPPAVS